MLAMISGRLIEESLIILVCAMLMGQEAGAMTVETGQLVRQAYVTKYNCSLVSRLQLATINGNSHETFQSDIFFGEDGLGNQTCGQCVPGTTGQWRVTGAPAGSVSVFDCSPKMPGILGQSCYGRDATRNPSGFYCGINEYCTAGGECKHIKSAPMYGNSCSGNILGECGPGLYCIQHRCLICMEGTIFNLGSWDPSHG